MGRKASEFSHLEQLLIKMVTILVIRYGQHLQVRLCSRPLRTSWYSQIKLIRTGEWFLSETFIYTSINNKLQIDNLLTRSKLFWDFLSSESKFKFETKKSKIRDCNRVKLINHQWMASRILGDHWEFLKSLRIVFPSVYFNCYILLNLKVFPC